jgi:uncharacterized protein YvpB
MKEKAQDLKNSGVTFMMKNAVIAGVLSLCALSFGAASDYTETLNIEDARLEEVAVYAEKKVPRDRVFSGSTIDQYVDTWEDFKGDVDNEIFGGKVLINVPIVNQYPEMPVGCEISAATSLINYMGFKISDTDFAKKYFPHEEEADNYGFWYDEDDVFHGPDPNKEFIGNPFGWGYGIYPAAVARAMNTYFLNVGSTSRAVAVNGLIEEDFKRLIDGGVPVIVWATLDMDSFNYRDPGVWITPDGKEITWYKGSHTLLLCGYDDDAFFFMDPNDKDEIIPYGKSLFMTRFKEAGEKAIIVKE